MISTNISTWLFCGGLHMLIYILCDLFIGGSCMGVNSAADTDCSEDVKPIIGMFVPHIIAVY